MSHSKATSGQTAAGHSSLPTQTSVYSVDRYVSESSSWTTFEQRCDTSKAANNDPMHSELDSLLRQAQDQPGSSSR
ncbi:hypothetical protein CGCS363_v014991 [Colletotrichum siamense]|uniref:uncharacterized protein n=1 Tax=Colletotrichum siamense TaxID=690259 RepID=UPI00187331DE|nr:uncharacterized protein CGCS363_v014991 [Colletotrichum siamense]KAF5485281.1 hypothetical protein CGCS363_v014991 [Colletotrichum siamense]